MGKYEDPCFRCRKKLRKGRPLGGMDVPLPADWQQRIARIDARIDPEAHAVVCWCGQDAEVQGLYDCRRLETVPWEVCRAGHWTRIERRLSA